MKLYTNLVTRLARLLDWIARLGIVTLMILVLLNVLLRFLFSKPILGVYEYSSFLTAVIVGLALAYCSIQGAHISMSFFIDRFSLKIKIITNLVVSIISFLFLILSVWCTIEYANGMVISGEVASITKILFYPFIYVVAFGLLVFSLTLLNKCMEYYWEGVNK